MLKVKMIILICCFLFSWTYAFAFDRENQPTVQLEVKGPIIPIVAHYIGRGITYAEQKGAICIILMDTPGGLDKSMREIIQKIMYSSIPVVVFVYPEGSRAASAGVYILYASHVAAMAPSTNLGSAHPVSIKVGQEGGLGEKDEKVMSEKITNDAVAYIRSLAKKRGRNEKWAEDAVRKSLSITSTEALEKGVIDILAKDPLELIRKLKGKKVVLPSGEVILNPSQSLPEKVNMTAIERFLLTVSDPSIALILMTLGLMGLIYEFMHPGAVLPGVVGAICFILALYSLGSLPINYAGLFLIFFSFILFFFEIKAPTHGILLIGGIVSLLLGTILLIPSGYPYFAISKGVIIGITLLTSSFFIFIVFMVAKSMMRKPVSGIEGMIGMEGIAKTNLSPDGIVAVHGEIWSARSEGDVISEGDPVRVLGVKGLKLFVRKYEENRESGQS